MEPRIFARVNNVYVYFQCPYKLICLNMNMIQFVVIIDMDACMFCVE